MSKIKDILNDYKSLVLKNKSTIDLLSNYQIKLNTINNMIDAIAEKNEDNPTYIRLTTKASVYRTLITELDKILK